MNCIRTRQLVAAMSCCAVAVILALSPSSACAEMFIWSTDAPFIDTNTVTVNFGATLSGITALDAVVTGTGGVQHWTIYQGVGNPTGSVPFNLVLDCRDAGSAASGAGASVWLPILMPFSEGLVFAPTTDWTWLQDGTFTLGVSYVHAPFPDVPMCYGTGYTLPVVDHIDIVVTCDSAVPTVGGSWGTVKAAFR